MGPIWIGGDHHEDDLLASCYRRCLELARDHEAKSVGFPAISTGVYGFPSARAAGIALATAQREAEPNGVEVVKFVCFDNKTLSIYEDLLRSLESQGG